MIFRAIWPIVDEAVPFAEMCRTAADDLPTLIRQAHAQVFPGGRFSIAPSSHVPGSGRVTESVLVWEAPAKPARRRSYWDVAA